jgi:hypothetical protein
VRIPTVDPPLSFIHRHLQFYVQVILQITSTTLGFNVDKAVL